MNSKVRSGLFGTVLEDFGLEWYRTALLDELRLELHMIYEVSGYTQPFIFRPSSYEQIGDRSVPRLVWGMLRVADDTSSQSVEKDCFEVVCEVWDEENYHPTLVYQARNYVRHVISA